ncbi:hypothetical protein E05_46980 [Plautia stali symbiont]|nr:hypothetical protein E05_46980 [Plautia stali symbiont]
MCQFNLTVPAGFGKTFRVRKGQFITVIDSEGSRRPISSRLMPMT